MARPGTPMSPVDTAWLRMESPANPMMIGVVLIFDRPIAIQSFRKLLEERFLRFRRFRQRVVCEGDRYYWQDHHWFNLDNHLHLIALPGKGDQKALQALVSDLNSTPLNPCYPLWQIHYVDNYQGGCALVVRIHHCIADGISLVRVLLSLTDEESGGNVRALKVPAPRPPDQLPEWRKVLHRVKRNIGIAGNQAADLLDQVKRDPAYLLELGREGTRVGRDLLAIAMGEEDPPSPLKGSLSGRKHVAWSSPLDLDEVKATAKAMGSTVNDILMSAATGALHTFLHKSGHSLTHENIHVAVPFNLRPLDQPITKLGNQFGLVLVPLPVQCTCPRQRLQQVHGHMQALKQSYQAQVSYGLLDILGRGPDLLERRALELLSRKASAVMTNVPGPKKPLYLCSARLVQPMFWVPQTGEVGVGLSIFSYDGSVQFGLISDKHLIRDPGAVTDAFLEAYNELRYLALGSGSGAGEAIQTAAPVRE